MMMKKIKKGYKTGKTVGQTVSTMGGRKGSDRQTILAKSSTIEIKLPNGDTKIIRLPKTSFGGRSVKKGGKI
tara:strand:- start:746 stop:961 length:216 start_codon:yes stop_codon:yes gene_type:complete